MKNKTLTNSGKTLLYVLTYVAYSSIYIARINLNMASPALKSEGILTTSQIGYLGSAFSVVYALGRLFNSMLADDREPRNMIGIGLLFCGLANVISGFLPPFPAMLLLWSVNALAQSMLWSSVLRIVNWLYQDTGKLTGRLSMIVSTVAAGNVAGILIALLLVEKCGISWTYIVPGFITLSMSLLVFTLYPLIEEKNGGKKAFPNPLKKLIQLLKNKDVRKACFPAVTMGALKENVTVWMAVFFADSFGIDVSAIAGYVLFIPIVGLVARLLFPGFLKKCGNDEHKVSLWSFGGCILSALLLVFVRNPVADIIALSLIYAFTSLVNSSLLSIFPARFAKEGTMAGVSGVMDLTAYLGAGIGSAVFGLFIDGFGYSFMFAVWAMLAVGAFFITRKMCGSNQ